jgi:hypothetical protein
LADILQTVRRFHQQVSVFDAPVLATLIRTEKHRLVLKMAVAEGPLEGLDHQGG